MLVDIMSRLITSSVGNGLTNNPDDIRKTRRNLSDIGRLETEDEDLDNGFITRRLDGAIRGFQRDSDLKEDGIIKPGGETETALGMVLRPLNEDDGGEGDDGDSEEDTPKPAPVPQPKPPRREEDPQKPNQPDPNIVAEIERIKQVIEELESKKDEIQSEIDALNDSKQALESEKETLEEAMEGANVEMFDIYDFIQGLPDGNDSGSPPRGGYRRRAPRSPNKPSKPKEKPNPEEN